MQFFVLFQFYYSSVLSVLTEPTRGKQAPPPHQCGWTMDDVSVCKLILICILRYCQVLFNCLNVYTHGTENKSKNYEQTKMDYKLLEIQLPTSSLQVHVQILPATCCFTNLNRFLLKNTQDTFFKQDIQLLMQSNCCCVLFIYCAVNHFTVYSLHCKVQSHLQYTISYLTKL